MRQLSFLPFRLTDYTASILLIFMMLFSGKGYGQDLPAAPQKLRTISVSTLSGEVVDVKVPNNIRPGDQITGSVVPQKTSSTLQGAVVDVQDKKSDLKNKLFTFIAPAGLASIPFLIKDNAGKILGTTEIPINASISPQQSGMQKPSAPGNFTPNIFTQPGQPLTITGNFDGNAANTNISINNIPCEKIAESPSVTFILSPANLPPGQATIKIEEGGVSASMPIQVVTVNLSTDNPVMQRNGKATISIKIDGAENLDLEKNHYQVELTNHSPGIVSIRGANSNTLTWDLNSSNTKNGSARLTAKLIGSAAGSYTISALLKAVQADTPPLLNEHPAPEPIKRGDGSIPPDNIPIDMNGVGSEEIKATPPSIERLEATQKDLERRIGNTTDKDKDKEWLNEKLKIVKAEIDRRKPQADTPKPDEHPEPEPIRREDGTIPDDNIPIEMNKIIDGEQLKPQPEDNDNNPPSIGRLRATQKDLEWRIGGDTGKKDLIKKLDMIKAEIGRRGQ